VLEEYLNVTNNLKTYSTNINTEFQQLLLDTTNKYFSPYLKQATDNCLENLQQFIRREDTKKCLEKLHATLEIFSTLDTDTNFIDTDQKLKLDEIMLEFYPNAFYESFTKVKNVLQNRSKNITNYKAICLNGYDTFQLKILLS
jgi:hypothetical protein